MTDQPEQQQKQLSPQHSTEAPCSANVRARIGGYDWQITCRSHVDRDDLLNMAKSIKWWNTWLDAEADTVTIEAPNVTAMTPPPATTTPSTPTAQAVGGTFHIVKMKVTPRADGKVDLEFFEANHKWADVKSTKTPADSALLLQPIGAWTPQHFAAVGEYQIDCMIDWKPSTNLNKNGQPYKNIAAVRMAQA